MLFPPCGPCSAMDFALCLATGTFCRTLVATRPFRWGDADLRHVAGNWCADAAAKAALRADLEPVQEHASMVAAWRKEQRTQLKAYFQYLIELSQQVVPEKLRRERADMEHSAGGLDEGRRGAAY